VDFSYPRDAVFANSSSTLIHTVLPLELILIQCILFGQTNRYSGVAIIIVERTTPTAFSSIGETQATRKPPPLPPEPPR
jgi:hypothetical protein